ncbi:hypothetical protein ABK040_009899 [Willaertia magna]
MEEVQRYAQLQTKIDTIFELPKGKSFNIIPYIEKSNPILQSDQRITRNETLDLTQKDLHYLLLLNEKDFWSHMIFDNSLKSFIESYLRLSPRPFDYFYFQNMNSKEYKLENTIHRKFFIMMYRLIVNNNLQNDNLLDVGDIIYDKTIIDIPKIFDLCSIYGYTNTLLISELIYKYFYLQPKLYKDLNENIKNIINISLRDLNDQILKIDLNNNLLILQFFYDLLFSIRNLLEIFPLSNYSFIYNDKNDQIPINYQFIYLLMEIYNSILNHHLKINDENEEFIIKQIRLNILTILHILFREYYMRNIEDLLCNNIHSNNYQNKKQYYGELIFKRYLESVLQLQQQYDTKKVEDLVTIMSFDILINKKPSDLILEFLNWLKILIKSEQGNIVKENITYLLEDYDKQYDLYKWLEQVIKSHQNLSNEVQEATNEVINFLEEKRKKKEEKVSEDISPNLKQLQSFFPDYGLGFLQSCLDYYKSDLQVTINSLMDSKLPSELMKLDKKLSLNQKKKANTISSLPSLTTTTSSTSGTTLLSTTSHPLTTPTSPIVSPSVWEDTDFFTRIRIGKKKDYRTNFNEIDEELKQRIISEYYYDDEYDDSYDDILPAMPAEGNEDENLNRVNKKDKHEKVEVEQQQEITNIVTNDNKKQPKNTKQIISNEQQQESAPIQQAGRGRGRGFHHNPPPPRGRGGHQNANRGRGRGYQNQQQRQQENNTENQQPQQETTNDNQEISDRDKQYKSHNKARIANHNRKSRGAKKRMNTNLFN